MRIGILGAARIAPKAVIHPAHVRGDAVLQGVAARDPARAEAFAKLHGIAEVFGSYEALIAAPTIDLVYNPLPINQHAAWTIRALEAGKHVLCEKPFAMNAGEAEAVLAAARASGRRVIEAFHHRYHPSHIQMLSWIGEGAIGEVQTVRAYFNVAIGDKGGAEIRHLVETGGGAFMDLGCYPLSWALSVLPGTPTVTKASAATTPRGVDESLEAHLAFPGGETASLSASMAAGEPFSAGLEVIGSAGKIVFINPVHPYVGGRLTLIRGEESLIAPIDKLSTYTFQLSAVLDALRARTPLPTEGEAILRQQAALDAIYTAAGLGHLRNLAT